MIRLHNQGGRSLAVRKSELGNRTRTTSPRLQLGLGGIVVVVGRHFGAVPIFGERSQSGAQFGGLDLVDSVGPQIHVARTEERYDDGCIVGHACKHNEVSLPSYPSPVR